MIILFINNNYKYFIKNNILGSIDKKHYNKAIQNNVLML